MSIENYYNLHVVGYSIPIMKFIKKEAFKIYKLLKIKKLIF